MLAASRFSDAEPLVWQLFLKNPSRLQEIADLIGLLVDAQQDAEAVALARKLEQFQKGRGDRRAFVAMMQESPANIEVRLILELMSELFNASNREGDYSQTLLKLFDLPAAWEITPKPRSVLTARRTSMFTRRVIRKGWNVSRKIGREPIQGDSFAIHQHGQAGRPARLRGLPSAPPPCRT